MLIVASVRTVLRMCTVRTGTYGSPLFYVKGTSYYYEYYHNVRNFQHCTGTGTYSIISAVYTVKIIRPNVDIVCVDDKFSMCSLQHHPNTVSHLTHFGTGTVYSFRWAFFLQSLSVISFPVCVGVSGLLLQGPMSCAFDLADLFGDETIELDLGSRSIEIPSTIVRCGGPFARCFVDDDRMAASPARHASHEVNDPEERDTIEERMDSESRAEELIHSQGKGVISRQLEFEPPSEDGDGPAVGDVAGAVQVLAVGEKPSITQDGTGCVSEAEVSKITLQQQDDAKLGLSHRYDGATSQRAHRSSHGLFSHDGSLVRYTATGAEGTERDSDGCAENPVMSKKTPAEDTASDPNLRGSNEQLQERIASVHVCMTIGGEGGGQSNNEVSNEHTTPVDGKGVESAGGGIGQGAEADDKPSSLRVAEGANDPGDEELSQSVAKVDQSSRRAAVRPSQGKGEESKVEVSIENVVAPSGGISGRARATQEVQVNVNYSGSESSIVELPMSVPKDSNGPVHGSRKDSSSDEMNRTGDSEFQSMYVMGCQLSCLETRIDPCNQASESKGELKCNPAEMNEVRASGVVVSHQDRVSADETVPPNVAEQFETDSISRDVVKIEMVRDYDNLQPLEGKREEVPSDNFPENSLESSTSQASGRVHERKSGIVPPRARGLIDRSKLRRPSSPVSYLTDDWSIATSIVPSELSVAPLPNLKSVPLYARGPRNRGRKDEVPGCKYNPRLHRSRAGCERCLYWASPDEKAKFETDGRHLRIMKVRGGCGRNCPLFPRKEDEFPVRLCKKCFHDTHKAAVKGTTEDTI